MPTAAVLAWVVPAALLLVAGWAQLRRGSEGVERFLDSAGLRLPAWALHVHPYVECALAVGLLAATGSVQVVSAVATAGLMATYLAVVLLALRRGSTSGCGCFGETETPASGRTVVRNVVLLGMALVAAGGSLAGESPRSLLGASGWWWVLAAASVAALGWSLLPQSVASTPMPGEPPSEEYLRVPIPLAWLSREAGGAERITLRELAAQRPQLLLFLSSGCSPCREVAGRVAEWSGRLPELDLVVVQSSPAPGFELGATPVLYDEDASTARLLGTSGPPSAVLLGVDGLLAGGPVHGPADIAGFVVQIRAELDAT